MKWSEEMVFKSRPEGNYHRHSGETVFSTEAGGEKVAVRNSKEDDTPAEGL